MHQSMTDPDARLYKKSKGAEAKLAYLGHVLMGNRHGLVTSRRRDRDARDRPRGARGGAHHVGADGRRRTLGADNAYDTADFVAIARDVDVTPHVAPQLARRGGTAIDGRTTRHAGYSQSVSARRRVERVFGWQKTVGWLRKVKLRGSPEVEWLVAFAGAAFNIRRLITLEATA
jgi:hypothetical protein